MAFRPGWAMTAFVLFFLPVTLALGMWQLNRAYEKNQLLDALAQQAEMLQQWDQGLAPAPGTPVSSCVVLAGTEWYLDNRTMDGRVGYDLYWPARLCSDGTALLIRAGWLEGPATRDRLPASRLPDLPPGQATLIQGQIRPAPGTPWLTAGAQQVESRRWRLQNLTDVPDQEWGEDTPIVQITQPEPWALVDNWDPVNMPPERHIGYAIQWFGLAAVLVVGFLIWGFHRGRAAARSTDSNE